MKINQFNQNIVARPIQNRIGSKLIIEMDDMPLSIDPLFCLDFNGRIINQAIREPLLYKDEDSKLWVGAAAKSFNVSKDKKVILFNLDPKKKWSDGKSVIAKNFVENFYRMFTFDSPFSQLFLDIKNAKEILKGEKKIEQLGVKEIDDYIFKVEFENSVPYLFELFSLSASSPYPSHITEINFEKPISNGSYQIIEIGSSYIELEINPFTEQIDKNSIKNIRFDVYNDAQNSIKRYKENIVDITCHTHFPFSQIEHMTKYTDFYLEESSILFNLQLNPNSIPILNNKEFKKNLYDSIDRRELEKQLMSGVNACGNFIPENLVRIFLGEDKLNSHINSKSTKNKFLNELKEITITFADFFPNEEIVDYIAKEWKDKMGITVIKEKLPFDIFVEREDIGDYDMCLSLVSPLFSHPFAYYIPHSYEMYGLENEEVYSSLLEKAMLDNTYETLSSLEETLLDNLPIIPICTGKSIYMKDSSILNYKLSSDGIPSFSNLKWKKWEEIKW
ncbi:ABC transporter substrate-binding protein [Rummeliibacillus pycnus]|uniref:ABC transporter substrate-binding protein n=1 Tax=Rummeliibacillus pycnus TaxID=101070 RepID=UPI001B80CDC5|nr:ABC transporter substrate-binding protein [Rummeliibacillus pycnus]